jgi:dihydropteroate synthase
MPTPLFDLCWQNYRMTLGDQTRIMGILNVTPDSFSDGGHFFGADRALAHAEKMVADGADIIDVGGESSRPFSDPVSEDEEARRVLPIIAHLAKRVPVPISIDTTKSVIARQAIDVGASIINDISSLRLDPIIGDIAAAHDVLLILMHMKGTPKTMQIAPVYDDLIAEIHEFLADAVFRAVACGVRPSRIIIDPGIGFGKTVAHNLRIINKMDCFSDLNAPILAGPSRKAFIRKILISENGDEPSPDHIHVAVGTQAAVAAAVLSGAHMVRVHDVAATRTTLRIVDAIKNAVNLSGESETV